MWLTAPCMRHDQFYGKNLFMEYFAAEIWEYKNMLWVKPNFAKFIHFQGTMLLSLSFLHKHKPIHLFAAVEHCNMGLYSLSGKTSYCQFSWSLQAARECHTNCITLKFDRHLSSTAAKLPVKFQSDWNSKNPNLMPWTPPLGTQCGFSFLEASSPVQKTPLSYQKSI